MSANNDKTTVGTGRGNWRTPQWLVDKLHARYQFDYDAAASHENVIKAFGVEWYSTDAGTYWRAPLSGPPFYAAAGAYVHDADGLHNEWHSRRVFINPPYGDPLTPCPANVEVLRCQKCNAPVVSMRHVSSVHDEMCEYGDDVQSVTMAFECTRKRCISIGHPDVYTPGIKDFVAKCASERNEAAIIVAVLPDARDTAWWREHVAPYADDYPIGRVKFIDPDTGNEGGSPPGGTAIVVWRPDWLAAS